MSWKQSAPCSLNVNPGTRTLTALPANSSCGRLGHPLGSNDGELFVGWSGWQLAWLQGTCWVNIIERGRARRQALRCPWVLAVIHEVIGVAERGGKIEVCV